MQRTLTYCFAAVLLLALAASRASADLRGTAADDPGTTVGNELLFSSTAAHDGLAVDSFDRLSVDTSGEGSASETGRLDRVLRIGSTVALLADGYDYVDGHGGSTNARVDGRDALYTAVGSTGEEVAWTALSGPEGTFFEASVVPNPTAVGNVHVLNIAWVDGTPGQSELTLVPVPGTFILGALGLGLAGLAIRRFT